MSDLNVVIPKGAAGVIAKALLTELNQKTGPSFGQFVRAIAANNKQFLSPNGAADWPFSRIFPLAQPLARILCRKFRPTKSLRCFRAAACFGNPEPNCFPAAVCAI